MGGNGTRSGTCPGARAGIRTGTPRWSASRRRTPAPRPALARRPALLAWDLTDEPPYWLFRDTTDGEARGWTQALRDADPRPPIEALVTIRTASRGGGLGVHSAPTSALADALDFACVHPYPIFMPELYPDQLVGPG
ncbi:MAG: hypothetical protein U0838_16725 [Chloroflexota bacterium]